MNLDSFREFCLSKPGVTEELPFGPDTLVMKVAGKMFALTGLESTRFGVSLKCDPEKAQELRASFDFVVPAFHMNKTHWNTVLTHPTLSDGQWREWIDDSYALVVASLPRQKREDLRNQP